MKCSFFFLFTSFALFVSHVASLDIHVSPQAIASSSTLVAWTRSDADADTFQFDLRFFQNDADAGLALANIKMDDTTDFGSANVTFPSVGTFTLKAVTGPRNANIGTSNTVQIFAPTSSTSASTSSSSTSTTSSQTSSSIPAASGSTTVAAVPTTTSASVSSSTSTDASRSSSSTSASSSSSAPSSSSTATTPLANLIKQHPNLPALVGGILGSLAGLGLLVALLILLHRRRRAQRKRLTFHRDMMVQRRLSRAPTLPPLDPRTSSADFASDVEQGLPDQASGGEDAGGSTETLVGPRLPLGTGHIVPSPKGPRPAAKRIATITTQRATGTPLSSPRPGVPSASFPASFPTSAPTRTPTPAGTRTRTKRQQDLAARAAMLRRQTADLQLELDRVSLRSSSISGASMVASPVSMASAPSGRAAELRAVLEDMQRQMVWLKAQESAPWALHLTDVLPAGHERYLRP